MCAFELVFALKPTSRSSRLREWERAAHRLAFAESTDPIAKERRRGDVSVRHSLPLIRRQVGGSRPGADPIVYQRTLSPEEAPDKTTSVEIGFEKGDAVCVDGKRLSPAALLARLNELGKANGIGRIDLVENRFVGMKSRGIYETPGGTILHAAHRAMESITRRGAAP